VQRSCVIEFLGFGWLLCFFVSGARRYEVVVLPLISFFLVFGLAVTYPVALLCIGTFWVKCLTKRDNYTISLVIFGVGGIWDLMRAGYCGLLFLNHITNNFLS
jgi:hypothetical protein